MVPSRQLSLGPMELQSLQTKDLTPLKSVQPGVVLTDAVLLAASRQGMQKKEVAALYDLSAPDFSSAFDPNDTKRNRLMKVELPMAFARQLAIVLCEQTGLAVAGPDAERHALADVLAACAAYVRLMHR